jgi:hypothetical protein
MDLLCLPTIYLKQIFVSGSELTFSIYKTKFLLNGMAELANAFVVHPKDLGSNLGIDRINFCSVCVVFKLKSEVF